MRKLSIILSLAFVVAGFVSCGDKLPVNPDEQGGEDPGNQINEEKTVKGFSFSECDYEGYGLVEIELHNGEEVTFTGFKSLGDIVQPCFWSVTGMKTAIFNAPDGKYNIYLDENSGLLYTEYPISTKAPVTYWIGGDASAYGHPKGGRATGSWNRTLPENRLCMIQTAPGVYETDAYLAGSFQIYNDVFNWDGVNRNSVSGIFLDGIGTSVQSTNENFSIPKGKSAGIYHIVLETKYSQRLMLEKNVSSSEVTFMTYNVCGLELNDVSGISEAVKNSGADVIGLQELLNTTSAGNQLEKICKQSGYAYYKFCRARSATGGDFGNGLISRVAPLSTKEVFLKCNIPNGEDRKALIAEFDDYYFCVTHLSQGVATGDGAWEKNEANRITQIQTLISELSKLSNKPVFFAADFNSQPGDSAGQEIQKTSYIFKNGTSAQNTYPSDDPQYRLDYVCQLKTSFIAIQTRGEVINTQASDHRPVVVGVK